MEDESTFGHANKIFGGWLILFLEAHGKMGIIRIQNGQPGTENSLTDK